MHFVPLCAHNYTCMFIYYANSFVFKNYYNVVVMVYFILEVNHNVLVLSSLGAKYKCMYSIPIANPMSLMRVAIVLPELLTWY